MSADNVLRFNEQSNAADRLIDATLTAERGVLGGILVDPSKLDDAADILAEQDFFRDAHRLIWNAMRTVVANGSAIDPLTVHAALGSDLDNAGGGSYLYQLTDGVPRATNVVHYARLVREHALRRQLQSVARQLNASSWSLDEPASLLLEQAEAQLIGLRSSQPGTSLVGPSERSSQTLRALDAAAKDGHPGLLCGIEGIDNFTFGFRPGQLIVLGARPSQGKTALALNIAVAAGASGPVLFASLEMSAESINARELSLRSGVPHSLIDSGQVPSHCDQRIADAVRDIDGGNIHVLDQPGATLSQIRGAARRLAASQRAPIAMIVVDYLQLMRPERGQKFENRTLEVSQFSAGLKQIARELQTPVLALSQLSRESERRTDKRPLLSDLRESGALEQDADIVLLLHRPGIYDHNPDDRRAEVIVAKQRNGPTGKASLQFLSETMRFRSDAYADHMKGATD